MIKRTPIIDIIKNSDKLVLNEEINIKAWVRTKRGNKGIMFLAVNDGSIIHNAQIIIDVPNFDDALLRSITTGSCVSVNGILKESPAAGQSHEIHATEIELYGTADPEKYPLQKKGHSMEFLRNCTPTSTYKTLLSGLSHSPSYDFAIHKFFNDRGFFNVHAHYHRL